MSEKRYTLRMNEELFNMAKLCANKENRSIAKEMELALSRYYLLLPFLDLVFKDYIWSIKDFNEDNLNEQRLEVINTVHDVLSRYPNLRNIK